MNQNLPIIHQLSEDHRSFFIRPIFIDTDPEELHEDPHRHNFQEILWIRSGTGQQAIDGRVLTIQSNSFYLIAKGQIHQFISGIDIDGLLIRFTDDFLPDFPSLSLGHYQTVLFNNLSINHTLTIAAPKVTEFENLLAMLTFEQNSSSEKGKSEVLRHLLTALLVKLVQVQNALVQHDNTAVNRDYLLFQQFTTLLEEKYASSHTVKMYAAALHITPRQLSSLTTRYLGANAKEVIEERIVLEAKRYLTFTNLSVKEIAFALGYKDPSYFSKAFKKRTGVTPQAYKA